MLDATTATWPLTDRSSGANYLEQRMGQFVSIVEHYDWVEGPPSRMRVVLQKALRRLAELGDSEPLVVALAQRVPYLEAGGDARTEMAEDAVNVIARVYAAGGLEDFSLVEHGNAGLGLFEAVRMMHPPVIMDMFTVLQEVLGSLFGTSQMYNSMLGASAAVVLRNDVRRTPQLLLEMIEMCALIVRDDIPTLRAAQLLMLHLEDRLRGPWWTPPIQTSASTTPDTAT